MMISNLCLGLGRRIRAWRDERGNAAILFALAAPVLIGGAGLAVETSFDYVMHSRLQGAADAAAFGAALEVIAGSSPDVVSNAASQQAMSNGWTPGPHGSGITVNSPPASGPHAGAANAVEVLLTMHAPRYFSALYSNTPVTMNVRSVAITQAAANACILALNKTASAAVDITGNTSVTLNSCDVVSDSVASNALNVWGSGQVSATCADSVGGIANHGGLSVTGCPAAITNAQRVPDPFASLPVPAPGPAQSIPKGNGNKTLSPGSYSGGMTLKGTVTMSPGVYYVSGGDFTVNGNATVTGSGVTIYLASGSHATLNGSATFDLTAPTSGAYSGILFFGDRNGGGTNTFNGNATSHLTGDLYFPSQAVSYKGNYTAANGCTHIVADTVQMTGSSAISVSCSAAGMQNIPARRSAKLVE